MRNQPHKPTSADIAMLAGVSRSTVSRVINGYPNVPEETRNRVLAVIDQHGYYPSVSGQTLRGKRARCVGVFLGETGWREEMQAAMLYAFSEAAQARGYMTLSGRVGAFGTPSCERFVREVLCSGCVDAGVFLNARGGGAFIRQLLREGQTIGALGCGPDDGAGHLFTVGADEGVAERVIAYTLSLGHRRIALLCDPHSHIDCHAQCARFRAATAGLDATVLCPPEAAPDTVERQTVRALDMLPTPLMLVCADHASVFAAYRAAYARGLAVGTDVSILGVGVLPPDLPVWPKLSGFRFDPGELVASLAERLIKALEGEPDAPRHAELAFQFMAGESCGRGAG